MAKILVAYSSLTDNTKKVAQAVLAALPQTTVLESVKQAQSEGFDLVIIGFWVDKGRPDAAAVKFIDTIKDQKTAFFFTLGAYPDSPHADDVVQETLKLLTKNGNTVLGHFRCQGKVDPILLEKMKKMLPPDHPHAQMTPERQARLTEAAKHPNEEDFQKAQAFAKDMLAALA